MQPDNYVGFRLPTILLAQIDATCDAQGISRSEWCRQAIISTLAGTADASHAYAAARAMLPAMLKGLLDQALANVPGSYEEAVSIYGVPPSSFDPYGG